MPRPSPIIVSSARAYAADTHLIPRTPHSRSGRAEVFTDVELSSAHEGSDDDEGLNTVQQQQSEPLLRSSASDTYDETGKRGQKYLDAETILSRIPVIIASILSAFLFFLIVIGVRRPGTIEWYMGIPVPGSGNTSTASQIDSSLLISYENYSKFPLHSDEYLSECFKLNKGFMKHGEYWTPPAMGTMDVPHRDTKNDGVCGSTITYMLDGKAGLFADIALMAQAAALARERNKTFLIDDTYWNRGKWSDYFQDVRTTQPGPQPGCKAPPAEELVACPRYARHWLITSRTAKFHFGHGYSEHYEDGYAHQLNRLRPMFDSAFHSLHNFTILPNSDTANLIHSVRTEFSSWITQTLERPNTSYVSVHVRRGDKKPYWKYQSGSVPIADYSDAVRSQMGPNPVVYLASDVPGTLDEFKNVLNSDDIFSLRSSSRPHLSSPGEYFQKTFDQDYSEEQRKDATRGMIVDFALLSGAWVADGDIIPDAAICTISSAICKMAAVGMGWDRAFETVDLYGHMDKFTSRWVDVDQKRRVDPQWLAFDMF